MTKATKLKTHPLNESPRHWHYILHSGGGRQTREHISPQTFATFAEARAAAEKVRTRNVAVAGIQCSHPSPADRVAPAVRVIRCGAKMRARLYTSRKVTHVCFKERGHTHEHQCSPQCQTVWPKLRQRRKAKA